MRYWLYSGAGNSFAITESSVSPHEAITICRVVAVDGVIFQHSPFEMRILNRDGSVAEMCGNGLRCFVKFLMEQGIQQEQYAIETLAGRHTAWASGNRIAVALPPPHDLRLHLSIGPHTIHHLNTGVPHAVLFVDSVEKVEMERLCLPIRNHPGFPEGANVNVVDPKTLRIRTFERGVERETLACGTGATASALILSKIYSLCPPLNMRVQSGETLKISFSPDWSDLVMEGPAKQTGEGTFCLKEESPILSPL